MKYTHFLYLLFIPILGISQTDHPQSSFVLTELKKEGKNLNEVYITNHFTSKGVTHTYYKSAIEGIAVYNSRGAIHHQGNNSPILKDQTVITIPPKTGKNPGNSIEQSIHSLAIILGADINNITTVLSPKGVDKTQTLSAPGLSSRPINARLQYYIVGKNDARLVWEIPIENPKNGFLYNYLVDTNTGEILETVEWTVSCNHGHEEAHSEKCLNTTAETNAINYVSTSTPNTYNVYNWPVESPNFGGRTLETDPWNLNAIASPNGWHQIFGNNYTVSKGNNTDTYLDDDNTNNPTGGDLARVDGGPTLMFDFPHNTTGDPVLYQDAALTNTFFWTNLMHDVWYNYGFDEQSGNFQTENYTEFGKCSDHVLSEVQDGSGTCNANFGTPPDGGNPRMQMYLCGTRDGDFDNGVIAHEFGHGVSNRLTGGPAASGCLSNQEQMGEGWSDYLGIVMTIEAGDMATDERTIGTWLFGQGPNGNGIRPFPYSTDMTVNPMTYDDIKVYSVPHGVGSVWATMLWDLTWAMIDVYGWDPDIYNGTGGNNKTMDLVMEGMKLQVCNPGFADGRDAIVEADQLLNGGANEQLIWAVFANRGLGFSAIQGSTNSRSDGTEAFDMPPKFTYELNKSTTATNLLPGEMFTYDILFKNNFDTFDLEDIVITDTIPSTTNFESATDGGTNSGGLVTFPAIDVLAGQQKTVSITLSVKTDLTYPVSDFFDDMESGTSEWNPTASGSTSWSQVTDESSSGTTSWFAPDNNSTGIGNLDIAMANGLGATSQLTFTHKFDTETAWDGGWVFISTDNGNSWENLADHFVSNGYNNTIYNSVPGFSGDSGGFITSVIDLSSYANQNSIIRFQMVCDAYVGGVGWWIDDVFLTDLNLQTSNTAFVTTDTMNRSHTSGTTLLLPDATDFQVDVLKKDITCFGDDDGLISLSPFGGSGSYTYDWDDGSTLEERTDLTPGQYIVSISDGTDEIVKAFYLVEPNLLEVSTSFTPILTDGGSEATITAMGTGGSLPYAYSWSTGSDSSTIVDLGPGAYTITLTDLNLCEATETVTITDPFTCPETLFKMEVQLDQFPEEFSYILTNDNDIVISSGGPYNTAEEGHSFIEYFCLVDDCYELEIIDSFGDGICASNSCPLGSVVLKDLNATHTLFDTCDFGSGATIEFCLPATSDMVVSKIWSDVTCDADDNGEIEVEVSGNYGEPSYLWSTGQTGPVIVDLEAGIYIVTITDFITSIQDTTEILGAEYSKVRESEDVVRYSLRDVLNTGCPNDTVLFDMDLLGDTLKVEFGDIDITGYKVLVGLGSDDLSISALELSRIFNVTPGATLHIVDMQLLKGVEITNGGAIYNQGNTIIENVIFEGNKEGSSPKAISNSSIGILTIRDDVEIKE